MRAEFLAVEGTRRRFTLTWHLSYEQTPPVEDADSALARTEAWWREWSGRSRYRGAYTDEVLAFRDFLLRVSSGDPAKLQIMYGIAGERRLSEFELPELPGYEGSKPVRVGNAASEQFQLDVYGEVAGVMFIGAELPADRAAAVAALAAASSTSRRSGRPDDGIWDHAAATALHVLQGDGVGRVRPRRAARRAVR